MLVSIAFLIVSKRKGWGLFWRPFLTTLSTVAIGMMLGNPLGSSSSNDPIGMLLFTVFSCFLIQLFLFHVMAGPILLGVSTVAISVWFVRGIKSLKLNQRDLQLEGPESKETLEAVSDLRYVAFLCSLLAITISNIFVTFNLMGIVGTHE